VNQQWLLPAALLLDLMFGDPNIPFHPVRMVGRYALWIEGHVYLRSSGRLAGLFAVCLVVVGAITIPVAALHLARSLHTYVGFGMGAFIVYASIAPRDLATHARCVQRALEDRDLVIAREAVGAIVGRDTAILDDAGISRAAVEAVAESCVDAVTAPIFWACLFGPVGAFAYRAINTLDSMWGYRDARYCQFGMVAARLDDAANYVPARLTLLWITAAAWLLRLDARAALLMGVRQGARHASPNSGLSEAAFAGALGVTLGGPNRYDGQWQDGPRFGKTEILPTPRSIQQSLRLMWTVTLVCVSNLTIISLLCGRGV
jgi:adenosylcobinamide-phosphate synthase